MSVSADACPAILGSDGAPVLVSADVVVTPVLSSSEDVVSNKTSRNGRKIKRKSHFDN